jgi:hypothetical protein
LLTLVHSDVPDDQRDYEEGGWEENYFEPMRAYFAKRAGAGEVSDADPPSAPLLPDEEPRPGAGRKPEMATPAAKVARAKKKAKRATAAKSRAKDRQAVAKEARKAKHRQAVAKETGEAKGVEAQISAPPADSSLNRFTF